MANKKDMRRTDLVIPYVEPKEDKPNDFGSTFSSTLPMAAMFTRNKMIGWLSLLISLLQWLSESPAQKRTNSTPGYLGFGMALMAVGVTYIPLFLPPPPTPVGGTGVGAPPPQPAAG